MTLDALIAFYQSEAGGSLDAAAAAAAADAHIAAVARSDAVNAALAALAKTDPQQFEQLRRQSFEAQAAALGL